METWASLLIKYAVILSVIFSTASFGTNWILFGGWGLSYSVAASPSDVLIGALEAWSIFGPHLFIGAAAWYFGLKLGKSLPKFSAVYILMSVITGLAISSISPKGVEKEPFALDLFTLTNDLYFDYLILWGPLVFFAVAAFNGKYPKILILFLFCSFAVIVLSSLLYSVQNRSDKLLIFGDQSRCAEREYVVWVGSDRVLTSCRPSPYTPQNGYFVIEKEGVEMRALPQETRI